MRHTYDAELPALPVRDRLLRAHPQTHPGSPHWRQDKFVNQEEGVRSGRAVWRWLRTRQPQPWPAWVENERFAAPSPRLAGADAGWRVSFINHATVLLQLGPYNLITDPVWAERVSPFAFAGPRRVRAPGIALHDLPPIDLVLLSHNHYDHMDLATLRFLHERERPLILTGLGNGFYLRRAGIDHVHELDWWQTYTWRDLSCHFVPARHFSGRGLGDRDQALWGGFVVDTAQGSLYFAGDTGWGEHFAQIAARWPQGLRLALLPIGAYEPRWFMRVAHMNPEDAVRAWQTLRAEQALAIHFNTFQLTDERIDQPVCDLQAAITAAGLAAEKFWVLREGEGRDLLPPG